MCPAMLISWFARFKVAKFGRKTLVLVGPQQQRCRLKHKDVSGVAPQSAWINRATKFKVTRAHRHFIQAWNLPGDQAGRQQAGGNWLVQPSRVRRQNRDQRRPGYSNEAGRIHPPWTTCSLSLKVKPKPSWHVRVSATCWTQPWCHQVGPF